MFEINHDDVFEGGGLVEEGSYEVVVSKAFEDAARSGTQFINLHLVIRNDIVGQKHQNQYLFGSIWRSKETGQYHPAMINTVSKALKIENGKKFNSLEELLGDFVGKTARVTVKHEEYNGNVNARVKGWESSRFNGCNHVFKESPSINTGIPAGFHPVDNDDIPF